MADETRAGSEGHGLGRTTLRNADREIARLHAQTLDVLRALFPDEPPDQLRVDPATLHNAVQQASAFHDAQAADQRELKRLRAQVAELEESNRVILNRKTRLADEMSEAISTGSRIIAEADRLRDEAERRLMRLLAAIMPMGKTALLDDGTVRAAIDEVQAMDRRADTAEAAAERARQAFDWLAGILATSARDWGTSQDLALVYGVILGWGDPSDPDDDGGALREIAALFPHGSGLIDRMQEHRATVRALDAAGSPVPSEPAERLEPGPAAASSDASSRIPAGQSGGSGDQPHNMPAQFTHPAVTDTMVQAAIGGALDLEFESFPGPDGQETHRQHDATERTSGGYHALCPMCRVTVAPASISGPARQRVFRAALEAALGAGTPAECKQTAENLNSTPDSSTSLALLDAVLAELDMEAQAGPQDYPHQSGHRSGVLMAVARIRETLAGRAPAGGEW